jgi:hypothetical protein
LPENAAQLGGLKTFSSHVSSMAMNKHLRRINPSGVIMSGPGMGGELEGPLEVMFAGMIGALAGFILGMLVGTLARIFTLNRVKGIIGGRRWAAYGAGAGALALAMMELFD